MTRRTRRTVVLSALTLLLVAAPSVAGDGAFGPPISAADRAELSRIEELLDTPGNKDRSGAGRWLVNLVSRHRTLPEDVVELLYRAASDPDPAVARPALAELERRKRRALGELREKTGETPASRDRREMERIRRRLDDPDDKDRSGAGRWLVNLASRHRTVPDDMRALLVRASEDEDPRIAEPAAAFLARRAGHSPPPERPERLSEERAGYLQRILAMAREPEPTRRLTALAKLRDMPLPERREAVRVEAFQQALSDPDPRVRSYAWFALNGGLAGDPAALAQVYVGPPRETRRSDKGRQPSSAGSTGAPAEGHITSSGVFVGAGETLTRGGGTSQPPSGEAVVGVPHEGTYTESGVFVGAAEPSPVGTRRGAGRQPQPDRAQEDDPAAR